MSLEVSKLRAVAHPVRLQILSLLTGAALSAAEIARELDISQANASYHLRVLADAGEVVAAGEEKIRGGVAKRYRHPWNRYLEPGRGGGPTRASEDASMVRALTQELIRRQALRDRTQPRSMTDAELWVTPAVWDEVFALVREASELIHDRAEPPRSPGTVHVNLTAILFRMTADPVSGTTP
jgi:DNA-binding transcriptional ArsR family regulator